MSNVDIMSGTIIERRRARKEHSLEFLRKMTEQALVCIPMGGGDLMQLVHLALSSVEGAYFVLRGEAFIHFEIWWDEEPANIVKGVYSQFYGHSYNKDGSKGLGPIRFIKFKN